MRICRGLISLAGFAAPFFLSGVHLFLVISGFIVGGLVIDNFRADGFFRSFSIWRATRILPLSFGIFGLFLIAIIVDALRPNPLGIWLLLNHMRFGSTVFMQFFHGD